MQTTTSRVEREREREKMNGKRGGGAQGGAQKRRRTDAGEEELRKEAEALRKVARSLPVAEAERKIVSLVKQNSAFVLIGETGSGKTTQVPQFLLKALGKECRCVAVTQPRRIAAVTIARRVAAEQGVRVGGRVGYAVRFDDASGPHTRIKYVTDGLLLRELLTDPDLSAYGAIVLDEAHERSVNTDVLFGLLKKIRRERRPDLKVIVMSATLDAKLFSSFWDDCPIGFVRGRTHPVEVFYADEPQSDVVDACVTTALQIHTDHSNEPGDILVFMTGQDVIEDAARILLEKAPLLPPDNKLIVVPLYAGLPWEKQARAFVPPPTGHRKVILSTNVAETSLTIPNIRFVIDCGLVKEKRYNPRTGMDLLTEVPVSQAQARQRCGRAGREFPGKCFRLFTERAFQELERTTQAEIRRVNLCSVVLQLKRLGIDNPLAFDFIQPPATPHLVAALHLLHVLGALDSNGKLTDVGHEMALFPLDPTHAKVVQSAAEFRASRPCVDVLAMLSVDNVLRTPSQRERELADQRRQSFSSAHGDHLTLLNAVREFERARKERRQKEWCMQMFVSERKMLEVIDVRRQLVDILKQRGKDVGSAHEPGSSEEATAVRKAMVAGFFTNIARYDPVRKAYVTTDTHQDVHVHPASVLFIQRKKAPLVMYNELVHTTKRYMRGVSVVEEQWVADAAPLLWRRAHAAA
eukprot:TRINITY_DN2798_c4_g1_i1.p1 TRINITY_DN2798_c4_g1~~TRINITY_DN2798_c4_g1_i1.p1  ORF type:complete len:693 (+),score=134.04 TRINITY_DN2798_c4_g1_i1:68-2146(+)